MSGKGYPEEFKIEAVKQVTNRGYKVGEVARRLGVTGSSSVSPVTVNGLSNGVNYTFSITATNAAGTGPASADSNSVTPYVEKILSNGFESRP